MNRGYLLPVVIAAAVVVGCAPMEQSKDSAPEEKTHITGSRISPHDSTGSANVQTSDDRNAVGGIVPSTPASAYPKGGR